MAEVRKVGEAARLPLAPPAETTDTAVAAPSGYDLVAIAASADGLVAIRRVLHGLPSDFPLAVAVVFHRTAAASKTAEILARDCSLGVCIARDGEALSPGRVYIAPPERHLIVKGDRTLHLMDGRKIKHLRSSANPLFESAAYSLGGRVIAVVLTGSGTDATDGVQTVKGMGGVVIAQSPASAAFAGMPQSAIDVGAVDHVVPLEDVAPLLVRLVGRSSR